MLLLSIYLESFTVLHTSRRQQNFDYRNTHYSNSLQSVPPNVHRIVLLSERIHTYTRYLLLSIKTKAFRNTRETYNQFSESCRSIVRIRSPCTRSSNRATAYYEFYRVSFSTSFQAQNYQTTKLAKLANVWSPISIGN